jgi:hypothetical protein
MRTAYAGTTMKIVKLPKGCFEGSVADLTQWMLEEL